MIDLADHPDGVAIQIDPVIRIYSGCPNQHKYTKNILKHVLGYRYPREWCDPEGWQHVISIDPQLREQVDLVLWNLGYLRRTDGMILEPYLSRAAKEPTIVELVKPLVVAYMPIVELMIQRWVRDFHTSDREFAQHENSGGPKSLSEKRYCLVDDRGGVFAGCLRNGHVHAKSAYRCAWTEVDCSRMTDKNRALAAIRLCGGDGHRRNSP